MHVKDQRAFIHQQLVFEKINQCPGFAAEFNLDEIGTTGPTNAFVLPEGKSLDQLWSAKKYEKLRRRAEKVFQFNLGQFKGLKPLLISQLITEQVFAQDMPLSLDEFLWQYAKKLEKECFGIESYKEQLNIMMELPLQEQLKGLEAILTDPGAFKRQTKKMAEWYQTGDIQKLYKAARKSIGGMRKVLLFRRNVIMANRIFEKAQQLPIVATFGAGHLAGNKGVLKLLKEKGVKLKPIAF